MPRFPPFSKRLTHGPDCSRSTSGDKCAHRIIPPSLLKGRIIFVFHEMRNATGFRRLATTLRRLGVTLVISGLACYWVSGLETVRMVPVLPAGIQSGPTDLTSAAVQHKVICLTNDLSVNLGSARSFGESGRQDAIGAQAQLGERELRALLEDVAIGFPREALDLAQSEDEPGRRQEFCNAVLRGWAKSSPDDAAAWAMLRSEGIGRLSMEAVFAGAVSSPERAIQMTARLCMRYPGLSSDFGQMLVTALGKDGAYEAAVRFASVEAPESPLLEMAFDQWSASKPQQAWKALAKFTDPEARAQALGGLISGWARSDPAATVTYALQLPPGADRARALGMALPQWADRDLLGAWEWVSNHGLGSDLNVGLAAVARLPDLVNLYPEIAVGWAESITEPELRANTLQMLAQLWARQNPEELRRFIACTPNLRIDDHKALIEGL